MNMLTQDKARQAALHVLPFISNMMEKGITNRSDLHIVVLDPTVPYVEGAELPVLFEMSLGDRTKWQYTYNKYARKKALVCWRFKMDSRQVKLMHPMLYADDDVIFGGGVYYNGLVVACSGVQSEFDELFARTIAATIEAFARLEIKKWDADDVEYVK